MLSSLFTSRRLYIILFSAMFITLSFFSFPLFSFCLCLSMYEQAAHSLVLSFWGVKVAAGSSSWKQLGKYVPPWEFWGSVWHWKKLHFNSYSYIFFLFLLKIHWHYMMGSKDILNIDFTKMGLCYLLKSFGCTCIIIQIQCVYF